MNNWKGMTDDFDEAEGLPPVSPQKEEPAFPVNVAISPQGDIYTSKGIGITDGMSGLTKRELFVAMAMHALIPNSIISFKESSKLCGPDVHAKKAIKIADALIAELAKGRG